MADPGSIGSIAPPGEDYLVRRIADLERKVRELGPSIAQSFQSTVQSLDDTVAHLDGLTTVSANGANLNTGNVPGDQVFHWMNSSPALTLTTTAETGNLIVTVGSGQCTLNPGNTSATAALSFSMTSQSGAWSYALDSVDARLYSMNGFQIGVPLIVSRSISVPTDEPVTITVQYGIWSASTTTLASAQFSSNYVMMQVIN